LSTAFFLPDLHDPIVFPVEDLIETAGTTAILLIAVVSHLETAAWRNAWKRAAAAATARAAAAAARRRRGGGARSDHGTARVLTAGLLQSSSGY